jgi:CrcB protein
MEFAETVAAGTSPAADDSSPRTSGPGGRSFVFMGRRDGKADGMGGLYVTVGGGLGALLRYGVSGWVQGWTAGPFPWGTMTVNALGSLLLGVTLVWLETTAVSSELRQFATIGLLGAFTTFSTFSYEAIALLRDGDRWGATGYVTGSLAAGLLGILVGMALASWMLQLRG